MLKSVAVSDGGRPGASVVHVQHGSHVAGRVITTERLILEPVNLGHVEDLWLLHQDEGIAESFAGKWSRQKARQEAAHKAASWDRLGLGKWMAYDKASRSLVGRGGLSQVDIAGEKQIEVGWAVRRPLWGNGLATEIGRASIAFAFSVVGASQVVAFTEVHNLRSRAVMERLGMSYCQEIARVGLVADQEPLADQAPFVLYLLPANNA